MINYEDSLSINDMVEYIKKMEYRAPIMSLIKSYCENENLTEKEFYIILSYCLLRENINICKHIGDIENQGLQEPTI